MATKSLTGKHNYAEFSAETIRKRVQKMLAFREEVDVENAHVKLSFENRKTGAQVPSVSLIPIADCGANCKVCRRGCYDIRNVCLWSSVQLSRATNSAIYHNDPEKYFGEIQHAVKFYRAFRWHIGGDIVDHTYLSEMVRIANITPACEFLCFTKQYELINSYIDTYGGVPKNLHIIFSDWRGAKFDNPHNLPISSPLWPDGTKGPHCTEKALHCPGNCTECAETNSGCWSLKNGETVLFDAH